MTKIQRPVRVTIGFGLLCAAAFIPLNLLLGMAFNERTALCLVLWGYAGAYSVMVCRMAGAGAGRILIPFVLLLAAIPVIDSVPVFMLLAAGCLSWVRSEVWFRRSRVMMLGAEVMFCGGGAALVAGFGPHSMLTWSLGIWLFFLVQSLYVVMLSSAGAVENATASSLFERARQQAEHLMMND